MNPGKKKSVPFARKTCLAATQVALAMMAMQAQAQQAPGERIEVTGSRIPLQQNVESTSPVAVISADDIKIEGGSVGMANLLKEKNIFSAPRYIVKPAFMCQVFQEKNTLGDSQFPFNLARDGAVDYEMANYPLTAKALHDVLVLPWNEKYTEEHVRYIAENVRIAASKLRK